MGLKDYLLIAFFLVTLPIWLPLIILFYLTYVIIIRPGKNYYLKKRVRSEWFSKGKYILFVYSESPVWKEYIEANIIPKISDLSIVLNWSERSKWAWDSKNLEVIIYKNWAKVSLFKLNGKRKIQGFEYNPIAIVFNSRGRVQVIRFWKAFNDYKHGKPDQLKELEKRLIETVNEIRRGAIPGSCLG